jgi:hypothetical protein
MPRGWPAGAGRSLPLPSEYVGVLGVSLVLDRPTVYHRLQQRQSADAFPNRLEPPMTHALTLIAAKAALAGSLALGFATMPHAVAHTEPTTSCQYEDGNPDGTPCRWTDPDTGTQYRVNSARRTGCRHVRGIGVMTAPTPGRTPMTQSPTSAGATDPHHTRRGPQPSRWGPFC